MKRTEGKGDFWGKKRRGVREWVIFKALSAIAASVA